MLSSFFQLGQDAAKDVRHCQFIDESCANMHYTQKAEMIKKQTKHVPLLSLYASVYAHASPLLSQQGLLADARCV